MKRILITSIGVDSVLWEIMQTEGVLKTVEAKPLSEIIEEDRAYKITNHRILQDPALIERGFYPEPRSKFHK